ncbi:hypothetical protein GCM10010336_65640 [Streptomyces goshikiensis]|nr:hypothetical protein GCM10010336_65640 [Streptomyces goshikiensis]
MGTRCTEVSRCGRDGSGLSWLTGLPALAVVIACALSEWCGGNSPPGVGNRALRTVAHPRRGRVS